MLSCVWGKIKASLEIAKKLARLANSTTSEKNNRLPRSASFQVGAVVWRRMRRSSRRRRRKWSWWRSRSPGWSVWTTWQQLTSNWSSWTRPCRPVWTSWPWVHTTSKLSTGPERWGGGAGPRVNRGQLIVYRHVFTCVHLQLLSDQGEYKEAMEMLRKALKLEPSTKVRGRLWPLTRLTLYFSFTYSLKSCKHCY